MRVMEATVCNQTASGELSGFKIGRSWRFDKGEVLKRITAAKPKAKGDPS